MTKSSGSNTLFFPAYPTDQKHRWGLLKFSEFGKAMVVNPDKYGPRSIL